MKTSRTDENFATAGHFRSTVLAHIFLFDCLFDLHRFVDYLVSKFSPLDGANFDILYIVLLVVFRVVSWYLGFGGFARVTVKATRGPDPVLLVAWLEVESIGMVQIWY